MPANETPVDSVREHGKLLNSPFVWRRDAPPPNTFEFALVLGGTVSAGAYTAGVIDFLIEALDAWDDARGKPGVPSHRVVLDVASGTSGGAICAVLLAKALGAQFSPWRADQPETNHENPFYRCWVKATDGLRMLETHDLDGSRAQLQSLLCADVLDEIAADIENWSPAARLPGRGYLARPLPLFLTLTNLRGVPYAQTFNGGTARREHFVQHADYVSLSVEVPLEAGRDRIPARIRPDSYLISSEPGTDIRSAGWRLAARFARGSAAFPIGLPLVAIERRIEDYLWRWVRSEDADGVGNVVDLVPQFELMTGPNQGNSGLYKFQCADGGVMNNLPIEIARTWLAGLLAHNPRAPSAANRAVIVVDPFSDVPDCTERPPLTAVGLPLKLLRSLVSNNRFATADQANFVSEETFSRFLITPARDHARRRNGGLERDRVFGGKAIASAGFDAFVGFFCEAFREHDFQLGRLNCQQFLSKWFVLSEENKVFHGHEIEDGAVVAPDLGRPRMRRIVYLADHLDPLKTPNPFPVNSEEGIQWPFPDWPKGALKRSYIEGSIRARGEAVTRVLARSFIPRLFGFRRWLYAKFVKPGIDDRIVQATLNAIEDDLREWDLH
jgi:hypothetical protein